MGNRKEDISLEVVARHVDDLMDIPEEYLPEILSERVEKLKAIRKEYTLAEQAASEAESNATAAVLRAKALVDQADNTGTHKASMRTRFWGLVELPPKTKDKIEAINENIKELASLGVESAEAQQELAKVQAAFAASQQALLKVQARQMEYDQQIADTSKYLFGLSARNMADSQSVLINLNAILAEVSEEEIGEMAKQQLMLAMDQLKNQENIKLRLIESEKSITKIQEKVDKQEIQTTEHDQRLNEQASKEAELGQRLDAQEEKDVEHDRRLDEQVAKDAEHDKRLEEQVAKAQEHDALLAQQAEKDIEHDKLLAQQLEKDEEHDRLFIQQELKDAEHDRLLAQQAEKDIEHDAQLAHQVEKDLEHDSRLNEQAEKDVEHDRRLAELEKRADSHDTSLVQHGTDIAGNADTIKAQADMIAQLNEEIANLKLALETKASKKSDLISLILAGISLVGVIIHFCT